MMNNNTKNTEPDIVNPCEGLPPKRFVFYTTISEGEDLTTEKVVLLKHYGMDWVEMRFRNVAIDLRPAEISTVLKALANVDNAYLLEKRVAAIEKDFRASRPKSSLFRKFKKLITGR